VFNRFTEKAGGTRPSGGAGDHLITMNRNQIGNEINHIGITELEVDYSHRHNWRCWVIDALMFGLLMFVIFFFCAVLQ
jgi:hypothetical protein